ncbi:hypothetical protein B0H14DRAFT_2638139 [Mycena olivaceomarginata]|nr:hypothetical protein B0H14DRAFT_2638139 [Mycena olivaceomarginata]
MQTIQSPQHLKGRAPHRCFGVGSMMREKVVAGGMVERATRTRQPNQGEGGVCVEDGVEEVAGVVVERSQLVHMHDEHERVERIEVGVEWPSHVGGSMSRGGYGGRGAMVERCERLSRKERSTQFTHIGIGRRARGGRRATDCGVGLRNTPKEAEGTRMGTVEWSAETHTSHSFPPTAHPGRRWVSHPSCGTEAASARAWLTSVVNG